MGQGEGHRDAPTIRGNSSTADFVVDGVRDDAQYYRDFYNLERVEALRGSNAMVFGRGGGGGVINRVTKMAVIGAPSVHVVRRGFVRAQAHQPRPGRVGQPIRGSSERRARKL
jgi:outer membrane receptor for monomeric catechols